METKRIWWKWLLLILAGSFLFMVSYGLISVPGTLAEHYKSPLWLLGLLCVAASALDLRGYSHFVAMGKPTGYLFTEKESRLPGWVTGTEWDMTVKYFTTSVFGGDTGLENYDLNGAELLISSPERAMMECLHLSPEQFTLLDTYYVMEMMTTLRPTLVQKLLEECTSIKVKRLFLYMAGKAGHSWVNALDTTRVNLGKGVRNISATGKFDSKYQIIIPTELFDYE